MSKTSKIITIIGVLCMLVPFMVLGSFASAETVTEDGVVTVANSFYSYWTLPASGGSRIFSFDYPNSFSFGVSQFYPYPIPDDLFFEFSSPIDVDFSLNSSALVSLSPNAVVIPAYFDSSTGNVGNLAIHSDSEDGQLHMYLLLVVYLDVTQSGTSSLPSVDEWYYFDNRLLSDWDCQSSVVNLSFIPDDGYYLGVTMPDSSLAPSLNLHGFFNSTNSIYNGLVTWYAVTWYSTPGNHTLAPNLTRIPPSSCLFSFSDVTVSGAGYSDGYLAGQQQGYNDGFTVGEQQGYNQGVTDGNYQANNTVNTGSASYIQGYQDGLDAPEYSFMSLISSIIDAPIRAFFGYTENGVTHPGLFNFNILGYDMSNLVLSIFSLCVLITILRLILGGK